MRSHIICMAALGLLVSCKFAELPPIDEDASVDGNGATQYMLTLTVDGAGSGAGSIAVEPGGFTCSSATCTRIYDAGTELTVTVVGASAIDGIVAVTGDCSATPCSLVMDGDRAVTAQFVRYACAPNTATCTSGMLTECDATGNFVSHVIPNGMNDGTSLTITMDGYACPMGCHATQPRCADITLGNGIELALDTTGVSPAGQDIVLPRPGAPAGTININTDNFDSAMGVIHLTDTDGSIVDIPAQVVEQPGEAGAVLVIKARTFTLRTGGVLKVTGQRAFGIASHFDAYLAGTIDASADWSTIRTGPGAQVAAACVGGYSAAAPNTTGGGGGACVGGASSAGVPGGAVSTVRAPFVVGGCVGGRGPSALDIPGLPGGGVLITSRRRIHFAGTSRVDLTGTGGSGGSSGGSSSARGGGSGGNLVVMAPVAQVTSTARIYTRGGGGAAASAGEHVYGIDGATTDVTSTSGATCTACGTGGLGGYEGGCAGGAGTGVAGGGIAGGGGAAGWCTFYSLSGAADASALATRCVRASETLQPRSP
ncbi:MAG: hypothetical protein F9K40_05575 [Kofleriaceae bacterium]|nr:MAG: hypothetical protein F9K40_05575 [Kofleriaceae bacterium]